MADLVPAGAPEPLARAVAPPASRHLHLVVVTTRPADVLTDATQAFIARYWHPRQARWVELPVESAEHAVRLFVDGNGWALRQQQMLDAPEHHELIFETRMEQLELPSAVEVLEEEVGLAPADVEEMLQRVEERVDPDAGAP